MNLRQVLVPAAVFFICLTSCSGADPSGIAFDPPAIMLQPGKTAVVRIKAVYPEDAGSGRRTEVKAFSKEPRIIIENPLYRILDVKMNGDVNADANTEADGKTASGGNPSSEGPSAGIVIKASETLLSGDSAVLGAVWSDFSASAIIKVRKDPSAYIDSEGVITDFQDNDALINKTRRLPESYVPADLVRIEVPTILTFDEVNHLRKPAAEALREMFEAAETEEGFQLHARSGYRSYSTQVSLYESNIRARGREYAEKFSARPGTSEHQSGLAMDISSPSVNYQLDQAFGDTPEGRWAAENAHRFGFIIRYPRGREEITGYAYEPWHLRYVGKNLAAEIYAEDLTLEEYFEN